MAMRSPFAHKSSIIIVLVLLSVGIALAAYVYRTTTQVSEALAEEVLEQQHDVATLLHEYANVMVSIERHRRLETALPNQSIRDALVAAGKQLARMRSNYSFARLDGAAKAHAFAKPVLEDVGQWLLEGIPGYDGDTDSLLYFASMRMGDRYPSLREIALETDAVATELLADQTGKLDSFRNSLIPLLGAFALLSLGIAGLLMRQRNLQATIAKDQETNALRLIDAESRGRQQAEEAMRGSQQLLRETLDSLPSNIAILDHDGTILAANTPWKKLIANGRLQLRDGGIGQHYEDVFQSTAADASEAENLQNACLYVTQMLADLRSSVFYEYPVDRGEQRRWFVVSVSMFNTGDQRHAVLVHEDVSQRKRLEERDRRLRAELAHTARLTTAGEMASGIAHELNQPLTAITHNCDAVLSSVRNQPTADTELLETLDDINEQAQRAGGIIRSMRQLVRKDSNDFVATNMNELVQETVRLTRPEAREKGVKVKLMLDENLPAPTIDPIQIQQVLVNLERNGVEAMWQAASEPRELTITTALNTTNAVQVSISDTGPGISPPVRKRLFTAFQTTKPDGMGLGLSISRSIVEAHGGRLWADPDTQNGTTFHFTIPNEGG